MPITKTLDFLPAVFQSEVNSKFLGATLDQLVTEPNVRPINGYIGRKFTPGWPGITSYVREPDATRADYQLEPSVVVKDNNTGELEYNGTYPDLLQKINFFGGNASNQNNLFRSEYYSYDPLINPDKFVNFGQYFWVPDGPASVSVTSGLVSTEKTFYIYPDNGAEVYKVSGYQTVGNPDLVLVRGGTYEFVVDQPGKNFYIQTVPGKSASETSRTVLGVTNNGTDKGTVTFAVPAIDAQDNYIDMPVVQNVDYVTDLLFKDVDGILLSVIAQNGGFDGITSSSLINGKSLIFSTDSTIYSDWVSVNYPTSMTNAERWGVWTIALTPAGSDYIVSLTPGATIPTDNKVSITGGITYPETQWYKNSLDTLSIVPPITAILDTLYYQDNQIDGQYGIIKIIDSTTNEINVDNEIVGKRNYISPNGIIFTNGLKIKFDNTVTPATYQGVEYYVEGVGEAIKLVKVSDLTVSAFISRANFDPTSTFGGATTAVELMASSGQITITSNADPTTSNIKYGSFPNEINSNAISSQDLELDYPYRGGLNVKGNEADNLGRQGIIGIGLSGIPLYNPWNGWYVESGIGSVWNYNSPAVKINGQDAYGGTVDNNNIYNYADSTFITEDAWGNLTEFSSGYTFADGHSKIIGFAADGYPIYGPYGYINPTDSYSGVELMDSGYVTDISSSTRPQPRTVVVTSNTVVGSNLTVSSTFGINPGMRLTFSSNASIDATGAYWVVENGNATAVGPDRYSGGANQIRLNQDIEIYANTTIQFEFTAGAFIEDYSYSEGLGTLDKYNGRFCVTPDFPNGTYAYFATQDATGTPLYPYFVGTTFYGSLDIESNSVLTTPEYILINRASDDKNPWSRRNRWFHEDVLKVTHLYNNTTLETTEYQRATRPIIEFDSDLQLYDFGNNGLDPVDIYDTRITDPFVTIEGATGAYLDSVNLIDGMRVIFSSATDPLVANRIYQVSFIDPDGSSATDRVIHLSLTSDGIPSVNDTVSILNGAVNAGKSFWYTGLVWDEGQAKTGLNQAPRFEVYDVNGNPFSDRILYPVSNYQTGFFGTKIFSYKEGTGTPDTVLGFPLSYKNIGNQGDIEFENNYDYDTFSYKSGLTDTSQAISTGFLRKNNSDGSYAQLNVWNTVVEESKQYQHFGYDYDGLNNDFRIDIVPEADATVPNLQVYVNFKKVAVTDYQVVYLPGTNRMIQVNPLLIKQGSRIDILVYSNQVSRTGSYQIPDNLNLNAQNTAFPSLTLGDFRNHIAVSTRRSNIFVGPYPGASNLRDVDVLSQGGSIVQQSSPLSYANMFLCDETYSFVDSVYNAQQEYTRFKNKFLTLAASSNQIDINDPRTAVDTIIKKLNQVKNPTFPWYYSDMVPYGDNKNTINYTVYDPLQVQYELTTTFTNDTPSNTAVSVYLNNTQLVFGRDYTFSSAGPAIILSSTLTRQAGDALTVYEYANTDGSWVPETPTKLGFYPKFIPEIVTDSTFVTTTSFIIGHDGSKTPIFGDYRDNLLLEFEKRIYNNIKVTYDDDTLSIYDNKPGKFRNTDYSLAEYNQMLSRSFLQWVGFNRLDYLTNTTYSQADPFSWNYARALDTDGALLPGSWRSCYEYFFDTQYPHLYPWQMLGFSEKPSWWETRYGPAPYTSGNTILWNDLEAGYIAEGSRQGYDLRFARPGLSSSMIPVDIYGNLRPPVEIITSSYQTGDMDRNWSVGGWGPVETAWRNSSEWPYAQQIVMALAHPAKYFSLGVDLSNYRYNSTIGQYLITSTNSRLTPSVVTINGRVNTDGTVQRTASYTNWIQGLQTSNGVTTTDGLYHYMTDYTIQLAYRMASYSDKNLLKVLAEQNSPSSVNNSVIIPDQDFDLVLGKSTPLRNIRYSGIIIKKTEQGFEVSGYDRTRPVVTIIPPNTGGKFEEIVVGNRSVQFFNNFFNYALNVPYGTVFENEQQIANVLAGYQRYLNVQGFTFSEFDETLGQVKNWELSTKEFLFWVQQNWAYGSSIVLSPTSNTISLATPNSTVDAIQNSFYGTKIMDQNFNILGNDAYGVFRDENGFRLKLDNTKSLLGYVELNLVQYEHVLIFNNTTQFNDVIYNPTTGARQFRLKLVGTKTAGWDGSLNPQGFIYNNDIVPGWTADTDYLKGDLVEYKNFYYSASTNISGTPTFNFSQWLPVDKNKIKTGLLNNFATNAGLGKDFYDVNLVNIESDADLLGFGLIGFRSRSYLSNAGVDDSTQVKFYQGFIKQKGTKNAFNAISTASFNGEDNNLKIKEQWAFRSGSYGSLETNQFVELVLDEDYTLNNPTSLLVNSNNSVTYGSVYTSQSGLYNSSVDPFSSPFLLTRTNGARATDIESPGYVNLEDINYTIFNLSDLSTFTGNINRVGIGETIWTANDYDSTWNVYVVTGLNVNGTEIVNALNGSLAITTDEDHKLAEGDTICMQSSALTNQTYVSKDYFNGFYRITSVVDARTFTINFSGNLTGFSRLTTLSPIYKLKSIKFDRASEVAEFTPIGGWPINSNVWINYNTVNDEWGVYNKSEPWVANSALRRSSSIENGRFGAAVKISTDDNFLLVGRPGDGGKIINYTRDSLDNYTPSIGVGLNVNNIVDYGSVITSANNIIAVGAPLTNQGLVHILSRSAADGALTPSQILGPEDANITTFGSSIAMSNDYQWLYVGAPDSDSVFTYAWYDDAEEVAESVSVNANASSYTLSFSMYATDLVVVANTTQSFMPYRDFTVSGNVITFDSNLDPGTYTISYGPGFINMSGGTFEGNANSGFGFSVACSTDGAQVLIGAPYETVGGKTDAGSITVYDRTIEKFVSGGGSSFGGQRAPIQNITKVYVNGVLQAPGIDYTVTAVTYISFFTAPTAGSIITIETDEFYRLQYITATTPVEEAQYGYSVDLCDYNCSVYAGSPYYSSNPGIGNFYTGAVYRHLNQGRVYGTITGTVLNPTVNNADSIRINDYEVVFISTDLDSVVSAINSTNIPGVTASNANGYLKIDSDSVVAADKLRILTGVGSALTDLGLNTFAQTQLIENPTNIANDQFGKLVKIDDTSERLTVGSDVAITFTDTTFDLSTTETTFDADSTKFIDPIAAGAVWIFNLLNNSINDITHPGKFAYVQQLKPNNVDAPNFTFSAGMQFGAAFDLQNNRFFVGVPGNDVGATDLGGVLRFENIEGKFGWDLVREQEAKVDIDGIVKSYIYDAETQTIIDSLDYIDPAKGKVLGVAEQDITYKIDYDPAVYNNSTIDTVSDNNSYHWTNQQVGEIWWDLSVVRYVDYEQGSISYRTSNWGRQFPGSRIDVYEWIESNFPPSQYVANGGDGVPKYENDEAYATLSYVDPRTNQATVKYYFWVKNKTQLKANQFGRTIPSITIANYINDPKNSGIKYFSPLRSDAVSVTNILNDISGQNTIFHVDYSVDINNSSIIHNEYSLLSEQDTTEAVPLSIYNKMVDSLAGADNFGNPVPDPRLPVQNRYGISIRPRQGVFINARQATREAIDYINAVLRDRVVSQGFDLSLLELGEPAPTASENAWDRQVPTFEILTYINVNILDTGYKVLVDSDETVFNLWTIYTLQADKSWRLTRVQSYRPSDYWEYIDWYAPGVTAETRPQYTVNTYSEFTSLQTLRSGDIVKIKNNGQNKWVLMQVFPAEVNTVGLQDGTIQFLDSLWNFEDNGIGFDTGLFDADRFDSSPTVETRLSLQALKEDIFIGELSDRFVGLFFTLVYYALNEQKSLDWVFKTSFIDVIQEVNGLQQPQIFSKDNQDIYKDYIEEVKPYHTTIKEYIVDYIGKDNWTGYTTDFDVPSVYDPVLQQYRSPSGEFVQDATLLQGLQYRDWLINYPYSISSIDIVESGWGYTSEPNVTITGSTLSNDAVARARITNGSVTSIEVLYSGTNYITQPNVTLSGGGGSGATAYAQLGNTPIRKLKTTLAYDRTTFQSTVLDWTANTSYTQGDIIAYNNVAYQATRDFTSGSTFVGNDLTIYSSNNFNNANDRIQAYYSPTSGMAGKDFSQLEHGIDYPGVTVEGPLFTDASGFGSGPFDYAPFDALSVDSDGTYIISDSLLDAKIESLFTDTSLGIRPEDINVDGGPFIANQVLDWTANTYYPQSTVIKNDGVYYITNVAVTTSSTFDTTDLMIYPLNPYTAFGSHAPEELVPGRVFDTLDITVSTFLTDCTASSYIDSWANSNVAVGGFSVSELVINAGGSGYDIGNVSVIISDPDGGNLYAATATVTSVAVDGAITGISIVSAGTGYRTVPTVTVLGANTSRARISPRLAQSDYDSFEYRIFKDMNDNYQYLRVGTNYETTLAENVTITSNTIVVTDASKISNPAPWGTNPGVIYINGERITYWEKDETTNTLRNIRRGTLGTGTKNHTVGDIVYDGSTSQQLPDTTHYTATNLSGVVVTTAGIGYEYVSDLTYIRSNLWLSPGYLSDPFLQEPIVANVTANTITTESNVAIGTETSEIATSPADGNGLFNSGAQQVWFLKH